MKNALKFNSFHDRISMDSGTMIADTDQPLPPDQEGTPPEQPLPPGLSLGHWALWAQSVERFDLASPIVSSGSWDVDDEGRIRSSISGLNIDSGGSPPSRRAIFESVRRNLWFIPPGRRGSLSIQFQLEQSVLALLDVNAIIIADSLRPFTVDEMMSVEFLQRFSRDLGLLYYEAIPPDIRSAQGNDTVSLEYRAFPANENGLADGGRYILIGATAKDGQSSFWFPGPTCAVGWRAVSWHQPRLHVEGILNVGGGIVAGWVLGDFDHEQLSEPFVFPRIRPRLGGEMGETSLFVTTLGAERLTPIPTGEGFIAKLGIDRLHRMFFTGRIIGGNRQHQWPVELTVESLSPDAGDDQ